MFPKMGPLLNFTVSLIVMKDGNACVQGIEGCDCVTPIGLKYDHVIKVQDLNTNNCFECCVKIYFFITVHLESTGYLSLAFSFLAFFFGALARHPSPPEGGTNVIKITMRCRPESRMIYLLPRPTDLRTIYSPSPPSLLRSPRSCTGCQSGLGHDLLVHASKSDT